MKRAPNPRRQLRALRDWLRRENARYGPTPRRLERHEWPTSDPPANIVEVWRSRHFLIQIYREKGGVIRISVNRAAIGHDGHFSDGLSWDELQEIKRCVGYGDHDAVEIYPADENAVNVANMRHLWVLPVPIGLGWVNPPARRAEDAPGEVSQNGETAPPRPPVTESTQPVDPPIEESDTGVTDVLEADPAPAKRADA